MVQCYPFLSGFLAAHELGEGHSFKEIKCGGNIKNLLLRKEKQMSEFLMRIGTLVNTSLQSVTSLSDSKRTCVKAGGYNRFINFKQG